MKKPKSQSAGELKPEDVKFGNEEMAYWHNLIIAKERDIEITKENLKFYEFILKYAKLEFEKAEKEYNKGVNRLVE